jgi:hypothetical protein
VGKRDNLFKSLKLFIFLMRNDLLMLWCSGGASAKIDFSARGTARFLTAPSGAAAAMPE